MQENRTTNFEYGVGYLLKGNKKKSRIFGGFFFIISLALVISFSYFFSSIIVGVSSKSVASTLLNEKNYYLLSLNLCENIESANKLASEVKSLDAGGYVYKVNNGYEVIAFAYTNENDAVNVLNKVSGKYSKSHILPLKLKKLQANIKGDIKGDVVKLCSSFEECYSLLYSIASTYTSKDYYYSLNLIKDFVFTLEERLNTIKAGNTSFLVKLKTSVTALVGELNELCSLSNNVSDFESNLKYVAVSALCYRIELWKIYLRI